MVNNSFPGDWGYTGRSVDARETYAPSWYNHALVYTGRKPRMKRSPHTHSEAATHSRSARQSPSVPAEVQDGAAFASLQTSSGGGVSVIHFIQPGQTLDEIARFYGIAFSRLLAANPEIDDPDEVFGGQSIIIPLTEPSLPPVQRLFFEYVIQSGDTLERIADHFGITTAGIIAANPRVVDPNAVYPGQILYVPTALEPPAAPVDLTLYAVRATDTLAQVADLFGVTLAALLEANPQIADPDVIFPGEIIAVPVGVAPPEAPIFSLVRYIVQPGDTLESIAERFGITPESLFEENAFPQPIPGLVLVIPEPIAVPEPPPTPPGFPPCLEAPFGQRLEIGDDDSRFVEFPEGFAFPLFGQVFSDGIVINSNGNLTFGIEDPIFFPSVDDFLSGPPRIAPLWSDLNPQGAPSGGGVFFTLDEAERGRRFVVTWDRVPFFGIEPFNTMQVSLYEDGLIEFCYFQVASMPEFFPRVLVGVARGNDVFQANIFLYNEGDNPRRVSDPNEATPDGSLSQRILLYEFDPEINNYRLRFS